MGSPGVNVEAGSWAERAQVCFNECLRVLTPHLDVLQQTEKDAFEELQTSGLLQAIQMYKLMYGGKALNFGITRECQHYHAATLRFH